MGCCFFVSLSISSLHMVFITGYLLKLLKSEHWVSLEIVACSSMLLNGVFRKTLLLLRVYSFFTLLMLLLFLHHPISMLFILYLLLFLSDDKEKQTSIRFLMSNAEARSVIGKGGQTITSSSQPGTPIQLSSNHERFPGTADRNIMISGSISGILNVMELIR